MNQIFDYILENQIGTGKVQYQSTLCLFLIFFCGGYQSISFSFTLPIIKKVYNLQNNEIQIAQSLIFFSSAIVGLFNGKISDYYGRKNTFIYSISIQFLSNFMIFFSQSFIQYTFFRLIYQAVCGLIYPLASCYTTEILPKSTRDKYFLQIYNFFIFGELFSVIIASQTFENLEFGNWRLLNLISSLINFFSIIYAVKYLIESPCYLLCCTSFGNGNQVFEILDKMGNINKGNQYKKLSSEDKNKLIQWGNKQQQQQQQNQQKNKTIQLFQNDYLFLTIKVLIIWFCSNFIYYGMVQMLPFIIMKQQENTTYKENIKYNQSDFSGFFIAILSEFPSNIFVYFAIDNPFFGRKKIFFFSYFFCFFINLFLYFYNFIDFWFFISVSICKFFINSIFSIIYQFTSELYSNNLRATAIGFCFFVSNFGAVQMPFVSFFLLSVSPNGPFLGFAFLAFICVLCIYIINQDTTEINQDQIVDNKELLEKQKTIIQFELNIINTFLKINNQQIILKISIQNIKKIYIMFILIIIQMNNNKYINQIIYYIRINNKYSII
ncbi:major facilitator superfamily protein, putative [Ichthyophthirius multifiliis]|uniref:Major facilitator superfamily protein, putative n=1 Tax=Ichthyophthirius multifiliis TaxID=5932 RepID=G0R106_ICHMU|nr:major facilitator superfamily protein, putative [Ichthyophthirius multifiliis]EGR28871.1 major facilitator superfamily protein, putative [Ichthyophthirius multifiliis]|eukprot:XP_004030107.1 major facilitator superfamily protein, putative [Ichthyophthirius multifiliis]